MKVKQPLLKKILLKWENEFLNCLLNQTTRMPRVFPKTIKVKIKLLETILLSI